jgi:hypothetical protein
MFVLNAGTKFSGALSNAINAKQSWTWINDDICSLVKPVRIYPGFQIRLSTSDSYVYAPLFRSFADREQIVYSSLRGMVVLYSLPEARTVVLMFYTPAFSFGMLRLTPQQYLSGLRQEILS